MNLFEMEPEKYWGFPSTYSQAKRDEEIKFVRESGLYLFSEKTDGHWHRFVKQDGTAKIQSRGISKVTGTYGDHSKHVPHIFGTLDRLFSGDTMIIGEMFLPGQNDNGMKKIFGCDAPKAVARQKEEKVRFRIFDVWFLDGVDFMKTTFEQRVKVMRGMSEILKDPYIEFVEYYETDVMLEKLEEIFEAGGEGIVCQKKTGIPEPGLRPAHKTLKIKKEIEKEIDCVVTGYSPATREYTGKYLEDWNYWENVKTGGKAFGPLYEAYCNGEPFEPVTEGYFYGWAGAIYVGLYKDSDVVPLCKVSGLSQELKADLVNNYSKYHLAPVVITGMEVTADRSVRHPKLKRFRDDINAEDCTWDKVFGK
jgi:ATP-dependent DNA ligase